MLRRHRTAAVLIASVVLAVVVVFVWASQQGYVSLRGQDCTDEGYNPTPSYDELVEEHGKTPYCARLYLGETWF